MKKEIQLNSRYNFDNRLIQIEGEQYKYKLKTDFNFRIGYKDADKKECGFIDPTGGPFIVVGSIIDNYKVKSISSDGIIEFEENDLSSN